MAGAKLIELRSPRHGDSRISGQMRGANRANDGQDQARQTYRATLREDGKKLYLIPRTRLRLHS